MRGLVNEDMPVIGQKINDDFELHHIIFPISSVCMENGEYVATLIIGYKNLPINRDFPYIPWNEQARQIIEYYKSQCSWSKTYNLMLFDDRTTRGELLNMYDAFLNQINDGDFVWARVRTEHELSMLNSLSFEYIRVTNQDYLMQKRVNLKAIAKRIKE